MCGSTTRSIYLSLSLNPSGCYPDACSDVCLCFYVIYNGVFQGLSELSQLHVGPLRGWWIIIVFLPPTILSNALLASPSLSLSVLSDFKNSVCYTVSSNLLSQHPFSLSDHTEHWALSKLKGPYMQYIHTYNSYLIKQPLKHSAHMGLIKQKWTILHLFNVLCHAEIL